MNDTRTHLLLLPFEADSVQRRLLVDPITHIHCSTCVCVGVFEYHIMISFAVFKQRYR